MTGFTNLALQMPLGYGGTLVSNANQILLTVTLPPAPRILLNLIAVPGNATGKSVMKLRDERNRLQLEARAYERLALRRHRHELRCAGVHERWPAERPELFCGVSATNIAGESANSAQAAARPTSPTATNLSFTASAGLLQLNWLSDHTARRLQTLNCPKRQMRHYPASRQ
jgi:hypothetical protein